jgi:DNA invertase Pin-like site-specific DNA recombinase
MKPMAGYIRVSRVGGRDKKDGFISPDIQRAAIEAWAERHGITVVIYEDDLNASGGTMDRPVFNKIMADIRAGRVAGLVVYKLDRFARTLMGALNTLEEFAKFDAGLASCVEDGIDFTTPTGRLVLQQLIAFAEYFRATVKESIAESQRSAIARGIHVGSSVKWGYRRNAARVFEPDHDFQYVEPLFRKRVAGIGPTPLAAWLDDVSPREDGRQWSPVDVQNIIRSRVYLGWAFHGEKINKRAHTAAVTEVLWHQAQDATTKDKTWTGGATGTLLSGIGHCAGCRHGISIARQTGNPDHGLMTYQCRAKHTFYRCEDCARAPRLELERFVLDRLAADMEGAYLRALSSTTDYSEALDARDEARDDLEAFYGEAMKIRRRDPAMYERLERKWTEALNVAEAKVQATAPLPADVPQKATRADLDSMDVPTLRKRLLGYYEAIVLRDVAGPLSERVMFIPAGTGLSWPGRGRPRKGEQLPELVPFDWPHDLEDDARVGAA